MYVALLGCFLPQFPIKSFFLLSNSPQPFLQFAYNATKAAATHITRMLATELARREIPVRVNALAPGVFESEMTHFALEKGLESITQLLGMHAVPTGRIGR